MLHQVRKNWVLFLNMWTTSGLFPHQLSWGRGRRGHLAKIQSALGGGGVPPPPPRLFSAFRGRSFNAVSAPYPPFHSWNGFHAPSQTRPPKKGEAWFFFAFFLRETRGRSPLAGKENNRIYVGFFFFEEGTRKINKEEEGAIKQYKFR